MQVRNPLQTPNLLRQSYQLGSMCRCSEDRKPISQSTAKTFFIGSDAAPAGEYHDCDFSFEVRDSIERRFISSFATRNWQVLMKRMKPGVAIQLADASIPHKASICSSSQASLRMQEHKESVEQGRLELERDRIESATLSGPAHHEQPAIECWENFHAKDNATAKFYKERRHVFTLHAKSSLNLACVKRALSNSQ